MEPLQVASDLLLRAFTGTAQKGEKSEIGRENGRIKNSSISYRFLFSFFALFPPFSPSLASPSPASVLVTANPAVCLRRATGRHVLPP